MLTRCGIAFLRLIANWPLAWVRALGWALGWLLYVATPTRRHIVQTNLRLCFATLTPAEVRSLSQRVFVRFAQALLDRSWLWHGDPARLRQRLHITGALDELQGTQPTVIFAPHFMGLDAGWTALTLHWPTRRMSTIYTRQANHTADRWMLAGRQRFGQTHLFSRNQGTRRIVAALRAGEVLYLLPDMDFGVQDSVFVPFYGVPAATVPSLSRFARLSRAKVVPVITRLSATGYEVQVLPAWQNFASEDIAADAAAMNLQLQTWIDRMPEQYYWVHKRFKHRPAGQASVY
jgi:KDO2-lipid IV(A) lauroyltransferase